MTAVNIVRVRDAVHMFTDGAWIDGAGRLEYIAPKAVTLPHLDAVFAIRGPKALMLVLATFVAGLGGGYDEVRAKIGDALRDWCAPALATWEPMFPTGSAFELFIAGISEQSGPDSYVVCSHDELVGASWQVVPLPPVAFVPGTPEMLPRFFPRGVPASFAPDQHGLALMEAQRAMVVPRLRAEPATILGGFAQLTTVTANGISTSILRRWPDQVGRPVAAAA